MAERSFGPVVVRRRLGSELRRLRDQAGMSLEQVARELEVSPSKISRLETGQSPAKLWDVRNLLSLYGVEDADYRNRAERWVAQGKTDGWWHPYSDASPGDLDHYISLEAEAAEVHAFCAPFLHGLVQTEGYARALLTGLLPDRPTEEIDGLVGVRMRRQEVLNGERPLDLRVIIDEPTLWRRIGGSGTMVEQYSHLAELSEQADVRVRPLTASPHPALQSPFTIFIPLEARVDPVVVNLESAFHDSYWESPEDVGRFQRSFDELSATSLDPVESRAFIRELADSSGP